MKEEVNLETYTIKELIERVEEGRKQIALGNYTDVEDVLRELDTKFEEEGGNKSAFTAAEEMHYDSV